MKAVAIWFSDSAIFVFPKVDFVWFVFLFLFFFLRFLKTILRVRRRSRRHGGEDETRRVWEDSHLLCTRRRANRDRFSSRVDVCALARCFCVAAVLGFWKKNTIFLLIHWTIPEIIFPPLFVFIPVFSEN